MIFFGHPREYRVCSSQPLAGQLTKPRCFWQGNVQDDGQRLPLSVAGCFLEFLLQGNVFILWNSCSLKIKTEQEHKSSVCPLGLLRAIGQIGGTSCVLPNCTEQTGLHRQNWVKFFSSNKLRSPHFNLFLAKTFQTPLVSLRAPDLQFCVVFNAAEPIHPKNMSAWAHKMSNSHRACAFKTMFVIIPKL